MSGELDRTVAACLFPGFEGTTAPDWIRRWLDGGLGGVVLFGRNVDNREQLASLTAALRAERPDVLVATDEEGGDVTRLEARSGSSYPGNWALGVVDDAGLTEEIAASIGSELASVGVNLGLAPVADVNSNPENPVIGIRAFGSEPELVSRHVVAFVAGLQRQCVAACAKHFPGHGDTSQDSHLELPVARGNVDEALEPFRAAIDAGVRSIMTAHVRVPALAEEQATLSRTILQGLLREELGFAGVAITDALEMKAVSETVGTEEGAVLAVAAGADALCIGAEVDEPLLARTHAAIVAAVASGRLARERIDEAAGRVGELARWAANATAGACRPELGADAARRALRIEGDAALTRPPLVLELHPEASIAAGRARHGLADALEGAETVRVSEGAVDAGLALLADRAGRQPVIVVRDAHRHEWEQKAVEALLAAAPDAVVVEVGLPLWRPESARGYIATYGSARVNFAAAAEGLAVASAARWE